MTMLVPIEDRISPSASSCVARIACNTSAAVIRLGARELITAGLAPRCSEDAASRQALQDRLEIAFRQPMTGSNIPSPDRLLLPMNGDIDDGDQREHVGAREKHL